MLKGLRVVITAGPTWEALDPVRGITNRSSGKMGYAIAQAALDYGAEVVLISGPVCIDPPDSALLVAVESAQQMYDAVHKQMIGTDVFVSVAAVADYRPAKTQFQKIKKQGERLSIELIKNPDIVASVGLLKKHRPFTVGFAAETKNIKQYAHEKLRAKGLDLIAANDVSDSGFGFGTDQNQLWLFSDKECIDLGSKSKLELAQTLLTEIKNRLSNSEK